MKIKFLALYNLVASSLHYLTVESNIIDLLEELLGQLKSQEYFLDVRVFRLRLYEIPLGFSQP